ncbi:MAG: prepilin-type N-terminal cleavage/methylation domain-containing protein [Candidatus Doudnabacteria bacterium]|nr:prepilin-type N-terminal cleavage/methylation domain-containing protein [Candidatus Doudnabacteria bacterium]
MLRNKTAQKGFTLIELLVVIAIIGLLASVVLLSLNSARAKSRDAKRMSDVRQIASALELFYNDNNSYPTIGLTSLVASYIGTVPTYPLPNDGTCGTTATAGAYMANYTGTAGGYTLSFCLGGTTGGYSAGTRTLTQAGIQ